jgi:hypothetical protein
MVSLTEYFPLNHPPIRTTTTTIIITTAAITRILPLQLYVVNYIYIYIYIYI